MSSAAATYDAFAVTAPGLARLAARELSALEITPESVEEGGVSFTTGAAGLYAANLHLRTASRVLVRVDEFRAATFHELEKRTARIDWDGWLAPGGAVALRVTCRKSRLYHSDAVAERVEGVIGELTGEVGRATGGEEDGEPNDARAQLLVVRLLNDRCTISIDASGALLHLRGYRQAVAKAPLRETLAAAMLQASEWDVTTPLLDPFCGSGTIPIEAALLARRIAPGRGRPFAFQKWPRFDRKAWEAVVERARDAELPAASAPIVGSDRDEGAIEAARANAERAGVAGDVTFLRLAASSVSPPPDLVPGHVLTNPPYGVRVAGGDLRNLYARFGATLLERFPGWRVGLLSPDPRLSGQLGMPLEERLRTKNGGIAVRLLMGWGQGLRDEAPEP